MTQFVSKALQGVLLFQLKHLGSLTLTVLWALQVRILISILTENLVQQQLRASCRVVTMLMESP